MNFFFPRKKKTTAVALSIRDEKFSYTLHTFADIHTFVHFALDLILNLVDAHAGSLFIWDECSKQLALKAFRSPYPNRLRDVRVGLGEGVCGLIAEQGASVFIEDIQQDNRFKNIRRNGRYATSSFLCFPLLSGHKLLGVINITEKENRLPFSKEDWERAELFSQHISVAYDNLRIRQRLQGENEILSQNLSELKETLSQQERLVAIGKVASHLTHELSNPLDAIRRFVNLALDQVMEDSLARAYLLKAKTGIRNSLRVIRGLLTLCREPLETPTRSADLHALIDESVDSLIQHIPEGHVSVEKDFCNGPIFVRDCGLQLVFKNLFENAYHAMNGYRSEPFPGKLTVGTKRENGHVVVSVKDNGAGISETVRHRIFDPFFTTKQYGEGTGIGLTMCRDIVEKCGGQITLGNCDEGGAEFTITLPVHESKVPV